MSNGQKFRVALSRDALKYYQKVDADAAARLDRCFGAVAQRGAVRLWRIPPGVLGVSPNSNPPTSPFAKGGQERVSRTRALKKGLCNRLLWH